ncbi:hypothetical protein DFS33DRAFT_1430373 [Desarmillaria ectypa]|nr:hypothetical protein DFS33DRAFT_1430373 [Desarmillaria ectypa]
MSFATANPSYHTLATGVLVLVSTDIPFIPSSACIEKANKSPPKRVRKCEVVGGFGTNLEDHQYLAIIFPEILEQPYGNKLCSHPSQSIGDCMEIWCSQLSPCQKRKLQNYRTIGGEGKQGLRVLMRFPESWRHLADKAVKTSAFPNVGSLHMSDKRRRTFTRLDSKANTIGAVYGNVNSETQTSSAFGTRTRLTTDFMLQKHHCQWASPELIPVGSSFHRHSKGMKTQKRNDNGQRLSEFCVEDELLTLS